ncbi:hypothetical protein [Cohnella fermenti]|uniref:Uncharacterized protein n=1 Tax=Cohnella fermenti TaxID=2565925 RepID=A0A4S4BVF9_9BACL|nr:hypothetical protein [Cohnella fermenti]THF79109.1 hypothetical protein E6C55_12910 [Cohnella fermenti]
MELVTDERCGFSLVHRQERFFVGPDPDRGAWSFLEEAEDGRGRKRPPQAVSRIVRQMGGIQVIRSDAAKRYDGPIKRAERTWIAASPHALFIVDRIEAERPVKAESVFMLHNGDNGMQVKVAAEHKLVLRRGGAGMKFFQVYASSEQRLAESGQAIRYASEQFQPSHTIVYAAALDDTDAVRSWHIVPLGERHFYVEPPAKTGGYSLELADREALIVHDREAGKSYRIDGEDRYPFA